MVQHNRNQNDSLRIHENIKTTSNVDSIIRSHEVQHFINYEIFKEIKDVDDIPKDAGTILPHIVNLRCNNRVTHNNNAADFQCRNTNNLKLSHSNTKQCCFSLPNDYITECIQRLTQIILIKDIHLIGDYPTGKFNSDHKFL